MITDEIHSGIYSDDLLTMQNEIKKLRADLEAAQKDSARLNWIEFTQSGLCMVIQKYRDNPNVDSLGWQVGHRQPRTTLRDAIDAAMKERKEQGE